MNSIDLLNNTEYKLNIILNDEDKLYDIGKKSIFKFSVGAELQIELVDDEDFIICESKIIIHYPHLNFQVIMEYSNGFWIILKSEDGIIVKIENYKVEYEKIRRDYKVKSKFIDEIKKIIEVYEKNYLSF